MRLDRTTYFAALDGLRAFSILFVIIHHVANKPAWMGHFHGWLGVDIFFVLSGFLITFLLERERIATGHIDMKAFYIRRAFRILPVYSVMLAVYIIVTYLSGDVGLWRLMKRDLPYFLTFLNEFAPSPKGFIVFGFSWTLGVEEKFYFFWPVFCFILLSALRWKWAKPMALTMLYLALVAAGPLKFQAARSYSGLLAGGLLALAIAGPAKEPVGRWMSRVPAILPLTAVCIGFYLVDVSRYYLFLFSWTVVFLVVHLVLAQSWLRSLLSNPVLTWLGKRSYGMYLIHMLPLEQIEKRVHVAQAYEALLVTLCTFAATALLADGVFRVIESPTREYGKRLLAQRANARSSENGHKPSGIAEEETALKGGDRRPAISSAQLSSVPSGSPGGA